MNIADLGERLAEERLRLSYTQVSFARLLGISRVALGAIEAGRSEFKVGVLTAAASAGVDVQYVLTGIRSQNAKAVADQLGFDRQAIHGPVSGVGFAGPGSNVHIINTQNHVTRVKAETKPGNEHISLEQRAILKDLVDKVVEAEAVLKKAPKSHRAVWSSLNSHCRVNTYTLIATDDFEKARKYLHMWLGRLNSSASAPIKDGDNWRKRHYAYIKINTKEPEAAAALATYMKRFRGAESIADLSNEQLEQVYRYVAGRRNRRR